MASIAGQQRQRYMVRGDKVDRELGFSTRLDSISREESDEKPEEELYSARDGTSVEPDVKM